MNLCMCVILYVLCGMYGVCTYHCRYVVVHLDLCESVCV